MGMPKARTALRMARDKGVDEKVWQKVIDLLEKEENKY
jgi:hypothetical protein